MTGNWPGPHAPSQHVDVIVAMDGQLSAVPGQDGFQCGCVEQAACARSLAGQRSMVNEHDAEQTGSTKTRESLGQRRELIASDASPGHERRHWRCGVDPDQSRLSQHPHERKFSSVAGQDQLPAGSRPCRAPSVAYPGRGRCASRCRGCRE